jgi:hypothetical protein
VEGREGFDGLTLCAESIESVVTVGEAQSRPQNCVPQNQAGQFHIDRPAQAAHQKKRREGS